MCTLTLVSISTFHIHSDKNKRMNVDAVKDTFKIDKNGEHLQSTGMKQYNSNKL